MSVFGNRTQKREFLAPVLSGELVGALALTEPGGSSDAASIKTSARLEKEEFVLNGEKRLITNGGEADFLFVFAVTNPRRPARTGVSAIIVPRESARIRVLKLQVVGNARR